MAKKHKIQNLRSNVLNKKPLPDELDYGEIGVNYNKYSAALYIKNDKDEIVKVNGEGTGKLNYYTETDNGAYIDYIGYGVDVESNNIDIHTRDLHLNLNGDGLTLNNKRILLEDDLDGKQDVIEDLDTIRSGAAAGATAVQPEALDGKQDVIEDLDTIRSGAAAGATAVQPAALDDKQDKLVSGTNIKTLNNESLLGSGDIATVKDVRVNNSSVVTNNVANVTVPQLQTTFGDSVGHYINSDGYTDSNTCVVSAKNTKLFQSEATEGWSKGKLLFRVGRWGDDGYTTSAVPTATTTCDGVLGYQDKVKIDKIDTIEETANDAYGKANFASAKIPELYVELGQVENKVREIELFKFPNATIYGNPTIQQGQVSNFSENNYLGFPFIVDLAYKQWILDFSFTLPNEDLIKEQQNIFDSNFGLAFAIRPFETDNYVLAHSDDGQSWDSEITFNGPVFTKGETVYIRIQNDSNGLQIFASLDKSNYIRCYYGSDINPFPKNIFIGKSILDNHNSFEGSINLNDASLTINGVEVWRGMDDAGLSTRLATNLSNVDAEGVEKIKDIANSKYFSEGITEDGKKIVSLESDGHFTIKCPENRNITLYNKRNQFVVDDYGAAINRRRVLTGTHYSDKDDIDEQGIHHQSAKILCGNSEIGCKMEEDSFGKYAVSEANIKASTINLNTLSSNHFTLNKDGVFVNNNNLLLFSALIKGSLVYTDFNDILHIEDVPMTDFVSSSTIKPIIDSLDIGYEAKTIHLTGIVGGDADKWFKDLNILSEQCEQIEQFDASNITHFYETFNNSEVLLPAHLNCYFNKTFVGCFENYTGNKLPETIECGNLQFVSADDYYPFKRDGHTGSINPWEDCFGEANVFTNLPTFKGLRYSPSMGHGHFNLVSTIVPTEEEWTKFCKGLGTPVNGYGNFTFHPTVWDRIKALNNFERNKNIAIAKGWTFNE